MADKKKRQTKRKPDDQKKKNTKGGNLRSLTSSLGAMQPLQGNPQQEREKPRKIPPFVLSPPQQRKKTQSVSIKNPHIVPPVLRSPYLPSQRPFVYAAQQRPNTHNPLQKKILQKELNQLQEYFHELVLERMLVCNKTCNEDGRTPPVEILSTSCGGQPPTLPPISVILDYECFEEKDKTNKNIKKDECCTPLIKPNCKKLIKYIKELLTEILTEFFKLTSSPVMINLTIAKVAKACVVSYFIETITTQLIDKSTPQPTDNTPNSNNSNSSNKKEVVKFYIKVSVQAITGGNVNTARDFLVHVNVNSLKTLLNVPNINVLTSKIIINELKQIPNIVDEIKSVLNQYKST